MQTFAIKNSTPNSRNSGDAVGRSNTTIASILRTRIQPKLKIGAANDSAEIEADRVADQIMRMPAPADDSTKIFTHAKPSDINRKCTDCGDEDKIQRKESPDIRMKETGGTGGYTASAESSSAINSLGSGSPLPASERAFFEPRFGQDLSHIRVHTGGTADAASQSINARAFSLGNNIAFANGEYQPGTHSGRTLMAHEITHTLQGSRGVNQLVRRTTPEVHGNDDQFDLNSIAAGNVARFYQRVREYIQSLNVTLSNLTLGNVDGFALHASRSLVRQINEIQTDINENGLELSGRWWSVLLERVGVLLTTLPSLLDSMADNIDETSFQSLIDGRNGLVRGHEIITGSQFIQAGIEEHQFILETQRQNAIIESKVALIRQYVVRNRQTAHLGRLHGVMIANILTNDRPTLNSEQIRLVFDKLRDESERDYQIALFDGSTVISLLQRGHTGFQAYVDDDEGLLSGYIRGEAESLNINPQEERTFNLAEQAIAIASAVPGFFQGVSDSIISNIKGLVSLLTPSFWRTISDFVTNVFPNFVMENGFRFLIGQMVGQASADELRRLAVATPFEYGRTIGHALGFALTEVVLSFIGLGWVLKAFKGAKVLNGVSRSVMPIVTRIGRSGIVRAGFNISQALGEAINGLSRRIGALRNRLPAVTANGRMNRAIEDMARTDDLERAIRRAEAFESEARDLLSRGNMDGTRRKLDELTEVLDDLETPPARSHAATALDDVPVPDSVARRANDAVGSINRETQQLLAGNPEFLSVVERYPIAARAFKFCNSPCLPPIPPATPADYARANALFERAERVGLSLRYDEFRRFFHNHQDDLAAALDRVEDIIEPDILIHETRLLDELGTGSTARIGSDARVADSTRRTSNPDSRDPTDSGVIGNWGEIRRHQEVGRSPRRHSEIIGSARARRQALDDLYSGRMSLREFAQRFEPDGATQVYLRTDDGGGRFIDHIFMENGNVILRESKAVSEFRDSTGILRQIRRDLELLNRFPEARLRWRITVEESDVSARFLAQLRAMETRSGGRFRLEFGLDPNGL